MNYARYRQMAAAADLVVRACYSIGSFENGVTDSSGTRDEGDEIAWRAVRTLRNLLLHDLEPDPCAGVRCIYMQFDGAGAPRAKCVGSCAYRVKQMIELSSIVGPWPPVKTSKRR